MCPESPSQPEPLSKVLVGTWELLSRVDRTASGERQTMSASIAFG